MRFIDFLNVYQDHQQGGLPIVGKELISRYDIETGELNRETTSPKSLEGSFSTSLHIRCDGTRVSVEGNPSKWNRVDNLFGFTTFSECIQVYNYELLKLGLPPFTQCTKVIYIPSRDGKKLYKVTDGAMFRRIDLTRNLSVGKDNVSRYLNALSSQRIGKGVMPKLYGNGNTLEWLTTLWVHKLYNKEKELKLPRNKKIIRTLDDSKKKYREQIVQYCDEMGIVRDEKEFKRDFLHKKGLCFYGLTNENDFDEYLNDIDDLINRIEVSTMDYEHVSDNLLEAEICKTRQSANATQNHLFAWLYGQRTTKTSSYYIHKRRLLQLGIDISIPYDATKPLPQLKRGREILISTAIPPDWYQMPTVNNLRIAS